MKGQEGEAGNDKRRMGRNQKRKGNEALYEKSNVQKGRKDYLEWELDGEFKQAAILRRKRKEYGNDTSFCPCEMIFTWTQMESLKKIDKW